MIKILFLEDDDYMRNHTENLLATEHINNIGFDVKACGRIDLAKKYFKKNKKEIDCIVTDLNMSDEWLNEYSRESFGCILSGWVWLYHFVFSEEPDMPIVIYSGFLNDLKADNIPIEQRPYLKKQNIKCVAKGADEDNGFNGLIKAIKQVLQKR